MKGKNNMAKKSSTSAVKMVNITSSQYKFISALSDILIYILVLNFFVEYVETVVIDSFTISVLTAILIWLMLNIIIKIEHRVSSYFKNKKSPFLRALGYILVFLILFSSKFLIIAAVEWIFLGEAVIGHFIEIVLLVIAMMGAKEIVRRIYKSLGENN